MTMSRKKGKGKKSDAEWKLLHEQETRKRREELLETFMKIKINKETSGTRLNATKLNWQWRTTLRDLKTKELKLETAVLQESFEHIIDTKNRIITALANQIDEDETQHRKTVHSQMKSFDKLLDIQKGQLDRMERLYEVQKYKMIKMIREEEEYCRKTHDASLQALSTIESRFQKQHDELETSVLTEFQSRKDELLNKSLEEQHALRVQLTIALEGFWHQFQQLLRTHHENTKEKRKQFYELKVKDIKNKEEISAQGQKIEKLETNAFRLKRKLAMLLSDEQKASEIQQKERKEYHEDLQRLRLKMEKMKTDNESQLTQLALSSTEAIKSLETLIEKGEQILKLREICNKHAHSEFYTAEHYSGHHSFNEKKAAQKPSGCPEKLPPWKRQLARQSSTGTLEMFWRHFNEVFLEKCLLQKQQEALLQENAKLRASLKQYLDDLAHHQDLDKKSQYATTVQASERLSKKVAM